MEEEKRDTPAKWEKWAVGKKPSMKRRCEQHDYYDRGIYMITMAIEGRRPLLGTLRYEPAPHVDLSAFGERVKQCWLDIPRYYPVVEPMKLCIMPDHIHGVLFVHERMEMHLGKVIEGFKTGTRKAARELGLLPAPLGLLPAPLAQATGQSTEQSAGQTAEQGTAHVVVPFTAPVAQSRHTAAARAHGLLWEAGYNDRLLVHKGQLQRMLAYLDDNPRRLAVKRQHPEYFTRLGTITVAGVQMQAMGNRFLLDNPVKLQVQCSRHLYQHEIDQRKDGIIAHALDNGAVIVSPCISAGEQQIATAAMNEQIPLIVLLLNGFPQHFKPQPRYLEACAEGRLLMLSPFPYQNEKIENMRRRCLQLNDIAAQICDMAAK